mgnify:CR=1 FL=1
MDFSDILWVAILLISAFAGSRKKLRRKLEEAESASQPTPSQSIDPSQWMDNDDSDLEEDWFEDDADTAYATASMDEEATPYFTYETVDPEPIQTPTVATANVIEDNVEEVHPMASNIADEFNLRQAIIYQTIMENDYLADIK